jgi:hypothetical protein
MKIFLPNLAGASRTAHMLREFNLDGSVNGQVLACTEADVLFLEERTGTWLYRVAHAVAEPNASPHDLFTIGTLFLIHV